MFLYIVPGKKQNKKTQSKNKKRRWALARDRSGTKPQGLFNSASYSHMRPHFNSDRQIFRYSVICIQPLPKKPEVPKGSIFYAFLKIRVVKCGEIICMYVCIYQLQNRKGCRADPLSEVTRMRLNIFSRINCMQRI